MPGRAERLRTYASVQTAALPATDAVALVGAVAARLAPGERPPLAARATIWAGQLAAVEPILRDAELRDISVVGHLRPRDCGPAIYAALLGQALAVAYEIGFGVGITYAPMGRAARFDVGEYVAADYAVPSEPGSRLLRLLLGPYADEPDERWRSLLTMVAAARLPLALQSAAGDLAWETTAPSPAGPTGTRIPVVSRQLITFDLPVETAEQTAARVFGVLERRQCQTVLGFNWDAMAGSPLAETAHPAVWPMYQQLLARRLPASRHEVRVRLGLRSPGEVVRLLEATGTRGSLAAGVGQVMLDEERLLNVSLEGNAKGAALTFACRYGVAVEEIAALFGGDLVLKPRGYMGRGNLMAGMDG